MRRRAVQTLALAACASLLALTGVAFLAPARGDSSATAAGAKGQRTAAERRGSGVPGLFIVLGISGALLAIPAVVVIVNVRRRTISD